MDRTTIKRFGAVAAAVGMAATFVADWINAKSIEDLVEEKVDEALSKKYKGRG